MSVPGSWLLGYSTSGFSRAGDLGAVVGTIRAAGFDAVELMVGMPHLEPFPGAARRAQVRRALRDAGIPAVLGAGARHALGPVPHEPALASADPVQRAARIAFLTDCLDLAADVGVGIVTFHSGPLPEGQSAGAGWDAMIAGLRQVRARADAAGVRLALEFHPAMLIPDLAGYRRASRDAGGIPLALDVGHLWCTSDGPIGEALVGALPGAAYVQLEDIRGRRHVHLPIGEGEIPFEEVFRSFDRAGYAGLVCAEFHSGSIDIPEAELCRRTGEVLRRHLRAARGGSPRGG